MICLSDLTIGLNLTAAIRQKPLSDDCWAAGILAVCRCYAPSIETSDSDVVRKWIANQPLTGDFTENARKKASEKGGISTAALHALRIVSAVDISLDNSGWMKVIDCLSLHLPLFAEVKYNIRTPSGNNMRAIADQVAKVQIDNRVDKALNLLNELDNESWNNQTHLVIIVKARRVEPIYRNKVPIEDGRWVLILDASNHETIESLNHENIKDSFTMAGQGAVWVRWIDLIGHGYLHGFIHSETHKSQMNTNHEDTIRSVSGALRTAIMQHKENQELNPGNAMYQLTRLRAADLHLKEVAREIASELL